MWEYLTVDDLDKMKADEVDRRFNDLGSDGWELVAMVEYSAMCKARAVFKRRRP